MNAMQQAIQFRDEGMGRAIDNAQDACFDWPDRAYAFLVAYAHCHAFFISEDVSDAAHDDRSFPTPPTDRAWGSLYVKAAKAGVIVQCGAGRSRRRHASICPKWQSLVFAGNAA